MSTKQRIVVLIAILLTLALAIGLAIYSMAQTTSYDGIFVNGISVMSAHLPVKNLLLL